VNQSIPDIKSGALISLALCVLPDASTPAANGPIVTMFAAEGTVRHSQSKIRRAITSGLIACVGPTEIDWHQGATVPGW